MMAKKDNDSSTALAAAVETGNVQLVGEILNSKIKPDVVWKDSRGQKTNAICLASFNAESEIVQLLLEHWTNKRTKRSQTNKAVSIAADECNRAYSKSKNTDSRFGPPPTSEERDIARTRYLKLLQIVELLLTSGADVPVPPLLTACSNGNEKLAIRLIDAGADVNFDSRMGTPLKVAARSGHVVIVRSLLDNGAEANQVDWGGTALTHALEQGMLETSQVLIEHGADINLTGTAGAPALVTAVSKENCEVVNFLIEHQAELNARGNVVCGSFGEPVVEEISPGVRRTTVPNPPVAESSTALHVAIRLGREDIAQLLINAGAKLDETDIEGKSPLFWARSLGFSEIESRLIEAGAKQPEFIEGSAEATLLSAVASGDLDQVQKLVTLGLSVDLKHGPKQGPRKTPLIAASSAGQKEVVRWLLDNEATLDLRSGPCCDLHMPTPLLVAASSGHHEVIKELIAAGANPNERDRFCGEREDGALHLASSNGHSEVVAILVEAGAKLEALAAEPQTPLACACRNGHTDTAKLLIGLGANVNPLRASYVPPLTAAVLAGSDELAEYLLHQGAHAAPDGAESYHQPICKALDQGNSEMAERLLESASRDIENNAVSADGLSICLADVVMDSAKVDFAEKLIAAGANANCNSIDFTPLMGAVRSKSPQMVQLVVDAGASPIVATSRYSSPLVLAHEQL